MLAAQMYFIHWIDYRNIRRGMHVDEMSLLDLELIFICEPTCWIDQDPRR